MIARLWQAWLRRRAESRRVDREARELYAIIRADSLELYRAGYDTDEVGTHIEEWLRWRYRNYAPVNGYRPDTLYRKLPRIVAKMHPEYAVRAAKAASERKVAG